MRMAGLAHSIQLQNRGGNEPSITMINRDSSLSFSELEDEAKMMQTQLVTQIFSSR